MMPLGRLTGSGEPLRLLCIGAHCDDIEIGCGGTLLTWMMQRRVQQMVWVIFSSTPERKAEAEASADRYFDAIPQSKLLIYDFIDSRLPFQAQQVKDCVEGLRDYIEPDIIFTHYRQDRHQDHRLLSDLTWNAYRNHQILEYEITKYDGDLGQPNAYVAISADICQSKIEGLLQCFVSQRQKHWFDEETFRSLLRLRGLECHSRYAEAFYLRKTVL